MNRFIYIILMVLIAKSALSQNSSQNNQVNTNVKLNL